MAEQNVSAELDKFRKYLRGENNEDAKRPLLYPLFQKLFKDKFKIESDAHGADVYIEGQLLVESKTAHHQWLEAFYQALHYHRRWGLTYNTIMLVAHNFVGIWKLDKIPETAVIFHRTADPHKAPNEIGRENAKKTTASIKREIKDSAFYWLEPRDLEGDIFAGAKNLITESFEVLKILRNLDSDRLQINTHNFINSIKRFEPFFDTPIAAVHCFYTIVAYWDITSTVTDRPNGKLCVTGFNGKRASDDIEIPPRKTNDFKRLIESSYVFTNEGSGLTVDYYFSRFDEVLAEIDPEYVKQHGIFFTNDNLSKFALWFVKENFSKELDQNYIVFDPAGGSGNLVSSWKGKLKHKIVSELQPDLLKIIERRMKVDPFSVETGFTIIPKTSDNKGLNFLDCSAKEYLSRLEKELQLKNIKMDKPLAFLLNPPYKNTDENEKIREDTDSHYDLDKSIIDITGGDASKERYLAFLGQILNIAKEQVNEFIKVQPVVMIFTPTSWLIPRPIFAPFRKVWDKYFKYHSGFIVTSNQWFKLDGKWPLSFTIWTYNYNEKGHDNNVRVIDLTELEKTDLNISWNAEEKELDKLLKGILLGRKHITLDNSKGEIRNTLPVIQDKRGNEISQPRYNIYRNRLKDEEGVKIISGFPLKDDRHQRVKAPHGFVDGEFIGFMDDVTPVRLRIDTCNRLTNKPNRVWFRLDTVFINLNQSKVFNGPADNRSYCSYDLPSAQATFSWFAITKALNGVYPVWANQYDIWAPNIKKGMEKYWYSLCFAFVLAENRCVVTKFEKDNPVNGAPEVWVDNPLCPTNKESFWSTTLDKEIDLTPNPSPVGEGERDGIDKGDSAINLFKGAKPSVFENAHQLRLVDKTEAEEILWQYLRNRKVENCKFRRQHPIGQFIADFYCHERKLVVEVDGGYHNEIEQQEYDAGRTQVINDYGISVIRFTNEEVLHNIQSVLNKIRQHLKTSSTKHTFHKTTSPTTPSPVGEGNGRGEVAKELVNKITELYKHWNLKHCKGQIIENVGLQDEPYFKYFDYPDFLTPHSGLIQIRKYAEQEGDVDLIHLFEEVSKLTKAVKNEIYRLLVDEFKYFE
jgi:very-short-patch-repair endonuclease